MLVVETIAKIRRAFFGQGKAIKAICRELGLSRKVVRKVIRSGATEFHYERGHQPLPKIGPWRERLDALLLANAAKPAREQLTLTRIYEELRGAGYDGGYDGLKGLKDLSPIRKSHHQGMASVVVERMETAVLEKLTYAHQTSTLMDRKHYSSEPSVSYEPNGGKRTYV